MENNQIKTIDNISVSVVIPTYMRDSNLHGTLIMLLGQTRRADEIIVVDQTPEKSHDFTTETYLRGCENDGLIKLVRQEKACLSAARNTGIRSASGDITLFVDDDIIIGHDFIEAHLRCYLDQEVMVVSGQARPGSAKKLPKAPEVVDLSPVGFLTTSNGYNGNIKYFNRVSGGNFSFRRIVYEKIGAFDENFSGVAHGEDIDFALRCLKAKIPIYYSSGPWIYHLRSNRGGGRVFSASSNDHWLLCRLYLAHKHMNNQQIRLFVRKHILRTYFINRNNLINPFLLIRCIIKAVSINFNAKKMARKIIFNV